MQQAIIYVRVSSKEQKQEGYSIPAQRKLLREYAKANSFKIVKEFEDDETAKSAGRTGFGQMVEFVKNNKEVAVRCGAEQMEENKKDHQQQFVGDFFILRERRGSNPRPSA